MRLVKIDNVILNMDNVVMIKGHQMDNGHVEVYAYTQDAKHYVGVCESNDDYKEFMEMFYQGMVKNWLGEAISKNINEDEDKELWS
jgi:hypothetical protein